MSKKVKTFLIVAFSVFLFSGTIEGRTVNKVDFLILDAPVITCSDSDTASVVFTWDLIPDAVSYNITILTGQPFTLLGTTLTVTGLSPGEVVDIEVQAVAADGETSPIVSVSCHALDCQTADIMIAGVSTICFPDTFGLLTNLDVQVVANTSGAGIWSGNGVVNTTQGTFDPNAVGVGDHTVYYTFETAGCVNVDSITIKVREQGFADFDSPSAICVTDTTQVTFTGVAPPGAQLNWDFGNGHGISEDGESPYSVYWDSVGTEFIGLSIDNDGCFSNLDFASISIDMPLDTPDVACNPTFSDVEFVWNPVENANTYVINVINGPLGIQTSDTSYLLPDLIPGQAFGIRLRVVSDNACPGSIQLPVCYTTYCPEVVDVVVPIGPFCFDDLEVPDTIQLEQTLPDTIDFAQGVWRGNGIIDSIAGVLVVDQSMVGMNEVYIDYSDGVCSFSDTLAFEVITDLIADFSRPDTMCQADTLLVDFTGNAPVDATYDWDFGGAISVDGSGAGPYRLVWSDGGTKEIKLKVSNLNCNPDSITHIIEVIPELVPPDISCETTPSDILFTWTTIDGAANNYPVTVLQGAGGTALSDTSILFDGLMPFDTIRIQVDALSLSSCSDTMSTLECVAVNCPDISVQATAVDPICYYNDTIITLQANVTGEVEPEGVFHWEGDQIINNSDTLEILNASAGQTIIAYAVYEQACRFVDTLEIEVLAPPVASFTVQDTICITEDATITFDGQIDNTEVYNWVWDFDGGSIVSGVDEGPYVIHWTEDGSHTVSLRIEGVCHSIDFEKEVLVSSPIPPVMADCSAGIDSIVVTWPVIPNATAYHIEILEGLPFTMTSDTSIVMTNLVPEQVLNFSFYPIGEDVCGYLPYDFTCQTDPCPDYLIEIDPIADYCFDGRLDTLQPVLQSNTDLSIGTGVWSGLNLIDASTGLLEINANSISQSNQLFFTYTEGLCEYRDSIVYMVNPVPTADFSVLDSICSTEPAMIIFTGDAGDGATFNWGFSGGSILSGEGAGPYQVEWGMSGDYDISLTVEENNCSSEMLLSSINVDAPLPEMQVDCFAGLDSIWVSWTNYPSVDNYTIAEATDLPFVFTSDTSIVFSGLSEGQSVEVTIVPDIASRCDLPMGTTSCTTISCGDAMIDWSVEPICEGEEALIHFSSNTDWLFDVSLADANGNSYTLEDVSDGLVASIPILETTTFSITQIINKTVSLCQLTFPNELIAQVNSIEEPGTALGDVSLCEGEALTIQLTDQIDGFVPGGIWQETSDIISGGFDAGSGILQTESIEPGSYHFLYQIDSPAPCPAGEVRVGVIVNAAPVVNAGDDVALGCNRLVASLGEQSTSQGNDFTYTWTSANGTLIPNPNQLSIEVMDADVYTLTVENTATGCTSEDDVIVTSEINNPFLYLGTDPISCSGLADGFVKVDSVIGGIPPFLYAFETEPFSSQSVFGPLSEGSYSVVVKDANGCEASQTISISSANDWTVLLQTNLPEGENTIQLGDLLNLEAIVSLPENEIDSIFWIPDTLTFVNNHEVTTTPFETATFKVVVQDTDGCIQEDFVTIYVDKKQDVFVPMAFSPNDDGINDVFMIYAGQKVRKVKKFSIFNRWGEMLFNKENFQPNDNNYGWDGNRNGQAMNAGVYIYAVEVEMINGETAILSGDVTLLR